MPLKGWAGPAGHKRSHHGTRGPTRARGRFGAGPPLPPPLLLLHPRTVFQASSSPSTTWPPATGETSGKHLDPAGAGSGGELAWEGTIFIKLPGRGQRGPAPRRAGLGLGQDAAQPGGSCRIPGEQRPAQSPAGTSALLRPEGVGSRRAVPEKTRLILVGPGKELARGGAETGPVSGPMSPKTPDPPRWALVRLQQHHVCGAGAHVQPRPAPRGETPARSRLTRAARAALSLSHSPRVPGLLGWCQPSYQWLKVHRVPQWRGVSPASEVPVTPGSGSPWCRDNSK